MSISFLKDSFKDILQEFLKAEIDVTLSYKNVKVILKAIIRGINILPKTLKASTGNFN